MLRTLWLKFDRDWGWNLARLLAYACLTAAFAVLGFLLAVLALFLRIAGDTAEDKFVAQVVRFVPNRVTSSAVLSFTNTLQHAPWPVVVLGLLVAVWYGTRYFVVMESCLCVIFRRPKRTWRQQNLAALWMLLLFAILVPAILLSTTAVPRLPTPVHHSTVAAMPGMPPRVTNNPVFGIAAMLGGFLADFLLLLIAFAALTPRGVPMHHAAPGAALAAALAQSYLLIFPFYVQDVLHPSQFGTVSGFILVALVFFFAYAVFVVLGAELASVRAGYAPAPQEVTILLASLHAREVAWRVQPAARERLPQPAPVGTHDSPVLMPAES